MRITDLIKNSELFHLFAAKSRFLHFFSPGLSADHQLFNPEKYHIYITLPAHYFPAMFLPPVTASKTLQCNVSTWHKFIYVAPSGAGNVPSACFRFASACYCLQDVAVQRLYMHKFICATPLGGNSIFPKKEILIPQAGSDNQSIRPFQIPHYLLLKPLRYSRDSAGPCAGGFSHFLYFATQMSIRECEQTRGKIYDIAFSVVS